MVASAADVGGGGGVPWGRVVTSYVDAAREAFGGRTIKERALYAARNYGFESEQFARFVREHPEAARYAVDEFNRRGDVTDVHTRGRRQGQPLFPGAVPGQVSWAAIVQMYGGDPQINTPVRGTSAALERELERATRGSGSSAADRAAAIRAAEEARRARIVTAARIIGRGIGGLALLLEPGTITPEVPVQPRAPGPTTRGGARRPIGGPVKQPTVAQPVPGTGRNPVNVSQPVPGPIVDTLPAPSIPSPGPLQLPAPAQLPAPTGFQLPDWARSTLLGLLPGLVSGITGGGRSFRDPLTPFRPPGTDPLTGINTGMQPYPQTASRSDRCDCRDQRKKKRKKKRRTECYSGTYTEKASGLTKRKKRKVPCR